MRLERMENKARAAATAWERAAAEVRDLSGRPSDEEIVQALEEQRPMCVAGLRAQGRLTDHALDDVMGDVALGLMKSLPRFIEKGEVSLAAWANGVAKRALGEAARRGGRERFHEVSLEVTVEGRSETLMAEFVSVEGESADEFYLRLLGIVKDRIISRPGGVAAWRRMERAALQPVRGRRAREELREELAAVSGLPASVFGSESMSDVPARPPEIAEVGPELQGKGFMVRCSQCGLVGAPLATITDTMAAVREHRESHRSAG